MDEKTKQAAQQPQVELFDCIVIHAGNKDHEIPKVAVTAREIHLLRAIHGEGAVLEKSIKPHTIRGVPATRALNPKIEMFELARKYANTGDAMSGKRAVEKAFGTVLVGFEQWYDETSELERMEQEEAMRKRQEAAQQRKRTEQQIA